MADNLQHWKSKIRCWEDQFLLECFRGVGHVEDDGQHNIKCDWPYNQAAYDVLLLLQVLTFQFLMWFNFLQKHKHDICINVDRIFPDSKLAGNLEFEKSKTVNKFIITFSSNSKTSSVDAFFWNEKVMKKKMLEKVIPFRQQAITSYSRNSTSNKFNSNRQSK